MNSVKDIIVAIELGSSAIRAIAAKKKPDGKLHILAVEQEASNCVRNGVIENLDRTTQAIAGLVKAIGEKLKITITRVNVGLSGQSLHTVKNTVGRQFETRTHISMDIIDRMKEANCGKQYPGAQILDVATQGYCVGGRQLSDPVGLQNTHVEATYLNVIARSGISDDIIHCVKNAQLEVAELLVSPICLADTLLCSNDRRAGCALVDIGAHTTTLAVYHSNILRHLVVFPLGGDNVTHDIASLKMETEEAEELKMKYGTAFRGTEPATSAPESVRKVSLSYGREVSEEVLQDIIEARYEEILQNVWHRIKALSEFSINAGFTFVGGASHIPNLKVAFENYTNTDKQICLAKGLPADTELAPDVRLPQVETCYTLIALAHHGAANCATEVDKPEPVQPELSFGGEDILPDKPNTKTDPQPDTQPEEETTHTPQPKGPSIGEKAKRAWNKIVSMLSEEEGDED